MMKVREQTNLYKRFAIISISVISFLVIGFVLYRINSPGYKIIARSEWNALAPKQGGLGQVPERITIHHTGILYKGKPDAKEALVNIQKFHQTEKGWIDIAYHYLVDLEGRIYEGRNVYKVGDTATSYDPAAHVSVSVLGNYEIQKPSEKQLAALEWLIRWLCAKHNISSDKLGAHLDYANTLCPGKNLYQNVETTKTSCD